MLQTLLHTNPSHQDEPFQSVKKTDMVTKLICQLPDYDVFGRVGRLSFDPERVQDLGWTANDQDFKFNSDHISDPPVKKWRSHPMQLRSASLNNINLSFTSLNIKLKT